MSDLIIKVALDQSGVDAQLKGVMGKFRNAAKAMAAVTVPAAAVLGVVKTVDALARLGEQAIRAAGDLQDTADQLGVTAERLQELRLIGKQAGVEFEQMDKALSILNRTVGQAALGQGNFEETLASVGIQLRTAEGQVKSVSTIWNELSAVVRSGSISQAQAIALASSAFGREGGKIVNVLRMTDEQQQKVIDTAREFGAVISNEVVRAADEYADKLDLIQQGTQALDTQNKLLLAPLTLKWAELKNEIAGASAELFRAAGLVDDNLILQQRRLKNVEDTMARMREALKVGGVEDPNAHPNMQPLLDEWRELNTLIARAKQQSREAAASIAPSASMDEASDPVASEQERADAAREARRAAEDAAEHELALVTAVYEEKERLIALEAEQEQEWATVMAEERERVHLDELAQLQEWHQVLYEERERAADMELEQYLRKEGLLTQARKDGQQERLKFDQMATGMQVSTVLDGMARMTAGVAQHNKTMFKVNKLAALGQAVVNTAQGVTRALAEYPPPISFAMAALQAAAGAAQISAIKNTQFGGGGRGTTPSAAGGSPVVNDTPVDQEPRQVVQVRGINPSQLFSGRQIVDLINAAQKDGAKIVFQN
jgi:hypothetical protein